MGIYINPDNENFKSSVKREIYIDKTQMISVLNGFIDCDNKYLCISRPRRFGKTFANNMLAADKDHLIIKITKSIRLEKTQR